MGSNPRLASLKASQYFSGLVSGAWPGGLSAGWAVWPLLNRAALVKLVSAVADLANLERVVAGMRSGGAPIITFNDIYR